MKKCFKPNCQRTVYYKCTCIDSGVFICSKHLGKHNLQQLDYGTHNPILSVTILSDSRTQEFIKIAESLVKKLNLTKTQAISNSAKLITCINSNLSTYLSFIQIKQDNLKDLLAKLKTKKPIDTEFLDEISKTEDYCINLYTEADKLLESIQEAYKFNMHIFSESNDFTEALVFFDNELKLLAIDLESLKQRILTFSPSIGPRCGVCKVSNKLYFINGGKIQNYYKGESYLIDLEKNSFEVLPATAPNARAACVYKDKLVYIFGGFNGSCSHSTCQAFNLESKTFRTLPSLPQPSNSNSAATFGDKIYVAGLQINYVLEFDGMEYKQGLPFDDNQYKLVCSGWILSGNKLLKMLEGNFSQWPCTVVNYTATWLNSCCCFNRKKFIYFVDGMKKLMRIDTDCFLVEEVAYSL